MGNGVKLYVPDIHSDEISKRSCGNHRQATYGDNAFSIRYQPMIALLDGSNGKEYYEVILGVSKEVPADTIPDDFINNLFKSILPAKLIAGSLPRHWCPGRKIKTHLTPSCLSISVPSHFRSGILPWLSNLL